MKVYLATMPLENYRPPINHGLVNLTRNGFVNGETPLEDFGCYVLSSSPLPESEEELFYLMCCKMESADDLSDTYWCDLL